MDEKNMDTSNKKKYCADVKNVKQWLHSTNKRVDSLNYHMKYLKILYNDMPKIQESKNSLSSLNWQNSKLKVSNNDETIIPKQMNCGSSLQEYTDIQSSFVNEERDDIIQKLQASASATSDLQLVSSLSRVTVQNKVEEKERNESRERNVKLSSIAPRKYNIPRGAHTKSNSLSPIEKENMVCEEEQNQNWQHPYQKHLAEYSTELVENIENSAKSFEQLILDNENEYLYQELSSVRDDIQLNISDNVKDASSIDKSKGCAKIEKKEKAAIVSSALSSKKGSVSKFDDTVSLKIKKKRRKVHSSNSRSTVNTRDTNHFGKKDTKRRKQKNSVSNRHTLKSQQTSNEVVEIYHNAAAKSGSTSAIPSKHSKLDHRMNYINILQSSAINKQQSVSVKAKCEDNAYQSCRDIEADNTQSSSRGQSQKKADFARSANVNDGKCNSEISTSPLCHVEKCSSHKGQHAIIQASYCDPIITHNYEMPTLASKLKRANRSYFSRFSFRNIPFVVGTSVTPSHNLGLNIQQVLSIMKTRQSVANEMTPLLIRKISRGMKPASILMDQMGDQKSKLAHVTDIHVQKETLLENANVFLKYDRKGISNLNLNLKSSLEPYPTLSERAASEDKYESPHKKKDTRSENQLNTSADNKPLKLFASQQNVKSDVEIPDIRLKSCQNSLYDKRGSNTSSLNQSQDTKGIREVLINLHDQFEEMNAKYEKLQAKAKKSSDKDLEEAIQQTEKELTAKEDEINAVVNLYKEVMALKNQMKLLQEKNGYVCISTEIPLRPNKLYSNELCASTKSYGSSLQQRFNHRRGSSVITTREPTSLRLAGLLRQIQTFQKQLKLTSW